MPPRKALVKAPAERVYQSEPRRVQKRFPAPRRHTRSTVTPPAALRLDRQQTLTQLQFTPHSTAGELSDFEGDNEEEFPEERPNKRRRVTRSIERDNTGKRQSTLTQIGFFQFSDDEDDLEQEEAGEAAEQGQADIIDDHNQGRELETQQEQAEDIQMDQMPDFELPAYPTEAFDHNAIYQDQRPRTKLVIADSRPSSESPSPRVKRETQVQATRSPSRTNTMTPPLRTPHRRFRNEIPSSQSPAATPISTRSRRTQGTPSPLKRPQRVPLEEIPPNVLASRDSEPPPDKPSPTKSAKKPPPTRLKLRIADTFSAGEDSDEDWENFDPMESPSMLPAQKSQGGDLAESDEDNDTCVRKLDLKAFSPSKIHSSPRRSFHTAVLPSQEEEIEEELEERAHSPTPQPRPNDHSSSPIPTHRSAFATTTSLISSCVQIPSSPPVRSTAASNKVFGTKYTNTHASIRSSQATTVDMTQLTPRAGNHHTQHITQTQPPHFSSQTQNDTQPQPQPQPPLLSRAPSHSPSKPTPQPPRRRQQQQNTNPPSSPPMPSLPDFLLTSSPYLDTQAMLARLGSVSPLSSIVDSGDIVTFSQALGEDDDDDESGGEW